jgi:circadian clock protein KaiC
MTTVAKLATGVPGLDILTHGGFPEGRSTLVVGKPGVGKTILGLQVAAHFARNGTPTLILAVEESPEDLTVTGDSLGLDLSGALRAGTIRISDVSPPAEGPTVVSGEYDISGLIARIEGYVRNFGARAVVLDSAGALFSPRPPKRQVRNLFFQLVHALGRMQLTSIILAESSEEYGKLTTLGIEDYVCDVVIIFRNVVDAERRRRTVEVNKYRRSGHYKGEYPCTINARGLSIFPLDAKDHVYSDSDERYSSGLPGLDAMIAGGLVRDSIVIVRGPTGSGKTILASTYARAGALRGERVMYFGFEEPKPLLFRNMASIGMPLEELQQSGRLTVNCRYPEATSLEDLLVALRQGMEEFQPALVVLDSISSIEHSSSEKGFRQFMIGVASILREHGRSALLTQTVLGGHAAEHTAPYLSTIADAILLLDYSADEYDLKRTLRVLKMRGSQHVTHPYRLAIEAGGLKVETVALRPGNGAFAPPAGAPAGRLKHRRVLWIEDFQDAREQVALALEQEGAEVVSVPDGAAAFAALERFSPDLVLCDIGLPGEDGLSLLPRLRASSPRLSQVPAVALTAWASPEDRQRTRAAGFDAHLGKPVDNADLVAALADVSRAHARERG